MPHRLFIAIRPPEAVRDALVDTMERLEGARWVPDDNLHLTLRFIGEVERPLANDIATALARIEWPGFALSIDGVGHFAQRGRPTAVWARIVPSPALEGLRQKVEAACERAGAGREVRRFVPHITIARLSRRNVDLEAWLSAFGNLAAGPWQATSFELYESRVGHAGPHYEPVAAFPLGN
jgi:2'-5' RNA ligase